MHEDELRERLLPLLRERVFHVTSQQRFEAIIEAGVIKSNLDGSLGRTFAPSAIDMGCRLGYVCLFDLRDQTEEAIEWGLGCLYFLAPLPLGDDLAFLLISPDCYSQLVLWDDIKARFEIGAFHIPDVECWFPDDVPIAAVERVLLVHVLRRPDDPNSLENLLAASRK